MDRFKREMVAECVEVGTVSNGCCALIKFNLPKSLRKETLWTAGASGGWGGGVVSVLVQSGLWCVFGFEDSLVPLALRTHFTTPILDRSSNKRDTFCLQNRDSAPAHWEFIPGIKLTLSSPAIHRRRVSHWEILRRTSCGVSGLTEYNP
jgi:hypothetical protein